MWQGRQRTAKSRPDKSGRLFLWLNHAKRRRGVQELSSHVAKRRWGSNDEKDTMRLIFSSGRIQLLAATKLIAARQAHESSRLFGKRRLGVDREWMVNVAS